MQKIFISLILIFLAHFFTINLAYCEEDFFENNNFSQAEIKSKITPQKVAKSVGSTKKKGFFSRFKKDNTKTKFNYYTNKEEEIPQGYWGKLPNIEADFNYKKQSLPSSTEINMKIPTQEELEEENFKKAPFDDTLFLDKVIKKVPDSQYVNDIQKIKFALNNLKDCIEKGGEIQRFNACVNMLELYVQNFKKKYGNRSESLKESYFSILNTNYYAKLLGNLKYDSNYYSRYIPTEQGKYSKSNIDFEEQKLLNRVNKTLFLLNNES